MYCTAVRRSAETFSSRPNIDRNPGHQTPVPLSCARRTKWADLSLSGSCSIVARRVVGVITVNGQRWHESTKNSTSSLLDRGPLSWWNQVMGWKQELLAVIGTSLRLCSSSREKEIIRLSSRIFPQLPCPRRRTSSPDHSVRCGVSVPG